MSLIRTRGDHEVRLPASIVLRDYGTSVRGGAKGGAMGGAGGEEQEGRSRRGGAGGGNQVQQAIRPHSSSR